MKGLNVKDIVALCEYGKDGRYYVLQLFEIVKKLDNAEEKDLTPAMRSLKNAAIRCITEYRALLPEEYSPEDNSIVKVLCDGFKFFPSGYCHYEYSINYYPMLKPFTPKDKKALEEYRLANLKSDTIIEQQKKKIEAEVEEEKIRAKKNATRKKRQKKNNDEYVDLSRIRKSNPLIAFQFEELLGKRHRTVPKGASLLELLKARRKLLESINIPPEPMHWAKRSEWQAIYGDIIKKINEPLEKRIGRYYANATNKLICGFYALHPNLVSREYNRIKQEIKKKKNRDPHYRIPGWMYESNSSSEIYLSEDFLNDEYENWMLDLMVKTNLIGEKDAEEYRTKHYAVVDNIEQEEIIDESL